MAQGIPIEKYPVAQLSPEDERKLKDMEKQFSSSLNQELILVAYKDNK